jgi:hypothetical protein
MLSGITLTLLSLLNLKHLWKNISKYKDLTSLIQFLNSEGQKNVEEVVK